MPSLSALFDFMSGPDADKAADFINTVFKGTFLESRVSKEARALAEALEESGDAADTAANKYDNMNNTVEETEIVLTGLRNGVDYVADGFRKGSLDIISFEEALKESEKRLRFLSSQLIIFYLSTPR